MNTYCDGRSSCPARLFSFSLLDGPQVRLCRPHLREAPAGFGLSRLVTAFMNNPGLRRKQSHLPSPQALDWFFFDFNEIPGLTHPPKLNALLREMLSEVLVALLEKEILGVAVVDWDDVLR
jgi:hypothetical protein